MIISSKKGLKYMKKILMVSYEGLGNGGVQAVMMNIIRNLKCEYEFDVLLFTNEVRYYDDEVKQYGRIIRIPFYEGSNNFLRRLDYYIRGYRLERKIERALLEYGPYDVIHCNNDFESALCIKAAYKVGIPIRIAHSHISKSGFTNIIRQLYDNTYRKIILKYGTCFIGCSKKSADYLFGNDSRKKILLNAVDLNKFSIERYGNIRISDTFIHIGRYDDNKNQKFILDVFYQYKKLKPNALLKLVGYSLINVDYKTELYKKVDELKLKDSVEFLPHDSDIPFLMAQSEYMIFPSRSEGLPLVCLEAQAMGVKCFISDSVTKEVDLGLCEFISLNEDSNFWVKRIVDNKLDENNIQDKTKIGLDRYIGSIKRIYEGNLD